VMRDIICHSLFEDESGFWTGFRLMQAEGNRSCPFFAPLVTFIAKLRGPRYSLIFYKQFIVSHKRCCHCGGCHAEMRTQQATTCPLPQNVVTVAVFGSFQPVDVKRSSLHSRFCI
jgi:hypothetical protein